MLLLNVHSVSVIFIGKTDLFIRLNFSYDIPVGCSLAECPTLI